MVTEEELVKAFSKLGVHSANRIGHSNRWSATDLAKDLAALINSPRATGVLYLLYNREIGVFDIARQETVARLEKNQLVFSTLRPLEGQEFYHSLTLKLPDMAMKIKVLGRWMDYDTTYLAMIEER